MKKQERYELKAEKALLVFEFISTGPRGEIAKLVQYSETNLKDFYNLGFGDKDPQTGDIDDRVISNNGDSQKVLASVAATVYALRTNTPMPGFMRPEARKRARGCIASGSRII